MRLANNTANSQRALLPFLREDLKLEEQFYPVLWKWSLRTAQTVTQMVGVPAKTTIMII